MASSLAFIEGLGGPELLMVLFVVMLLFGAQKLPELARGMGKAMREIKKATSGVEAEIRNAMEQPEPSEEAKRFAPRPVVPPTPAQQQPGAPTGTSSVTPPIAKPLAAPPDETQS